MKIQCNKNYQSQSLLLFFIRHTHIHTQTHWAKFLTVLSDDLRRDDSNKVSLLARDASSDDDAVIFHSHDFQLLNSCRFVPELTVHLLSWENSTRRCTSADGTVLSMRFGAVGHQTSGETPSFDRSLEAFTD